MTLLTSPVGTVHWMAAAKPVTDSKTGKENYSLKLSFDVVKDAAWLATVSEINDAKVVTAKTYRGKQESIKELLATGQAFVEAKSSYAPQVYDSKGNQLEEAPMFFKESTATAQMIVQPWIGEKGGTFNLVGIIIHTIESPEGTGTTDGTDRETRLAQLRAAVEAATKG